MSSNDSTYVKDLKVALELVIISKVKWGQCLTAYQMWKFSKTWETFKVFLLQLWIAYLAERKFKAARKKIIQKNEKNK